MPDSDEKRWVPRSSLLKIIPFMFYALLFVFLFLYLRSIDFSKLESVTVDWRYMIPAVGLGLVGRYWGAFIWFVILAGLGAKNLTNKTQLVYVYAKAWMGRYIPGTAPWILGKIYFASQYGISKNKLAVSSLLEGGLQILVTMTLASLILVADRRLDVINPTMKLLIASVIIAGIIALIPAVFNRLMSLAYKILRKKQFQSEHFVNGHTILSGGLLYVIASFINGLSLFFVAKAAYPALDYADMLFVIGAGSLAGAASMLVIFAPSGIGVRESIQLVLLNLIMPPEVALVVVVLTRIFSIIIDIVFWGLARSMRNKNIHKVL